MRVGSGSDARTGAGATHGGWNAATGPDAEWTAGGRPGRCTGGPDDSDDTWTDGITADRTDRTG